MPKTVLVYFVALSISAIGAVDPVRSCGDPGHVRNGLRTVNLLTFPNKVEFKCKEGFELRGNKTRYCQASGEWSGRLPACEHIYCPVPSDPVNGRVAFSSLEYGSQLEYKCNEGYMLRNHQARCCSEDGKWNGTDPECAEIECKMPEKPLHGSAHLIGELKPGSLALFSCHQGWTLVGTSRNKCLPSGSWTFDPPKCLRLCKVPSIQNGELGSFEEVEEVRMNTQRITLRFNRIHTDEIVEDNKTMVLRCKEGFLPSNHTTDETYEVMCIDGVWSKPMQCQEYLCLGEPPSVEHASPVVNSRKHKATMWYKCDDGYEKIKSGNVTCKYGKWDGITTICADYNCTVPLVYHGDMKEQLVGEKYFSFPWKNNVTDREHLLFRWKNNETYREHWFLRWKNTVTYREIPVGTAILNASSLHLFCNKGYWTKSEIITCFKGQWLPAPACLRSLECGYPGAPAHGMVRPIKDIYDTREAVTFVCDPGFLIRGPPKRVCLPTGTWTGRKPRCDSSLSSVHQLASSRSTLYTSPANLSIDGDLKTCTYTSMIRPRWIRVNMRSQYKVRTVVITIPHNVYKEEPANFTIYAIRTDTGNASYQKCADLIGKIRNISTLELSCVGGEVEGNYIHIQDNRKKNDSFVICEIQIFVNKSTHKCGEAERPAHSYSISANNSVQHYGCVQGYKLLGTHSRHCNLDGQWSHSQPLCQAVDCGVPAARYDYEKYILSNGTTFGSVALFQCGSKETLLTCMANGKWSLPNLNCKEVCPDPGKISNGRAQFVGDADGIFHEGSSIEYSCEPQYFLKGERTISCSANGTWSNPNPVCIKAITCSEFPRYSHLTVSYTNGFKVNSLATFTCEPPAELVGSSLSLCKADGKWSNPKPSCERISGCILKAGISPYLIIEPRKDLYRFGESVILSCADGYKLTSDIQIMMCLGSTWSDNFPDCI